VKEFIKEAVQHLGMEIKWQGVGVEEVGLLDGKVAIRIDPKYYRPTEVETLLGDPSKAKQELGWSPRTSFEELVQEMINADLNKLKSS
jgi:GDPmannose 4,6-dehydratase